VKGIPIDTIRKLARIVITENVFIYEKKFYRQVICGAMGSAFTLTLANIIIIIISRLQTGAVYRR
jgi:hypothetical protein